MALLLPQTNLQLYRLLINRGATEHELATVRAAYDAALQIFGGSARESHKPFVSHLVGVAGALARWGERVDLVVAGLLHSAYLFGDYRDGLCGAAPKRRQRLSQLIGPEAESLIAAYTAADWSRPPTELAAAANADPAFRDLLVLKLADVCDDLADCSPRFSPHKPIHFVGAAGETAPPDLTRLAADFAGQVAVDDLESAFRDMAWFEPPPCLVSDDWGYYVIDQRESPIRPLTAWGRMRRLSRRIMGASRRRLGRFIEKIRA